MSDIPDMTEFEFYGLPWEQCELYDRLSVLSYVENVTAPTLTLTPLLRPIGSLSICLGQCYCR